MTRTKGKASNRVSAALGYTGDRLAMEPLLDALAVHPELWQEASRALICLGFDEVREGLEALIRSSPSPLSRRGAVRALAGLSLSVRDDRAELMMRGYSDELGVQHPLL